MSSERCDCWPTCTPESRTSRRSHRRRGSSLVATAGALTCRQFVALSVFACDEDHAGRLLEIETGQPSGRMLLDSSIAAELDDLGNRRLLGVVQADGSVVNVLDTWGRRPL